MNMEGGWGHYSAPVVTDTIGHSMRAVSQHSFIWTLPHLPHPTSPPQLDSVWLHLAIHAASHRHHNHNQQQQQQHHHHHHHHHHAFRSLPPVHLFLGSGVSAASNLGSDESTTQERTVNPPSKRARKSKLALQVGQLLYV